MCVGLERVGMLILLSVRFSSPPPPPPPPFDRVTAGSARHRRSSPSDIQYSIVSIFMTDSLLAMIILWDKKKVRVGEAETVAPVEPTTDGGCSPTPHTVLHTHAHSRPELQRQLHCGKTQIR